MNSMHLKTVGLLEQVKKQTIHQFLFIQLCITKKCFVPETGINTGQYQSRDVYYQSNFGGWYWTWLVGRSEGEAQKTLLNVVDDVVNSTTPGGQNNKNPSTTGMKHQY